MDFVSLGRTSLSVSRLCLGGMTYGEPDRGNHAWTLPEAESRPYVKRALEMGVNFFDTAYTYSAGSGEEILGRALRDMAQRDQVVVAIRVHGAARGDTGGRGLTRQAIFSAIDASLGRLGMDHADLCQIHRFDPATPIEETLEAMDAAVRSGKIRHIGASAMHGWQFRRALQLSKANGWARFVSMQSHLNLLYREEERKTLALCLEEGVSVLPGSPLARGRLTQAWGTQASGSEARREAGQGRGEALFRDPAEADQEIVGALAGVARARGVPMAQVALAWLLGKPGVAAPIVGASKPHHLEDAVAALSLRLSRDEVAVLEAPYTPRKLAGYG